jgi:hypothetical protein
VASRPLTFGVRFRDRGRTVQVRAHEGDAKRYVLEVSQRGRKARQEHASLAAALRGFASAWRGRLH